MKHSYRLGSSGQGRDLHTSTGPNGLEIEPADRSVIEFDRPADQFRQFLGRALDAGVRLAHSTRAITPKTVFGRDDRQEIRSTSAYPWRAICALEIDFPTGPTQIGTGWLAGPRLVVTAGHCVYSHRDGGWARSIAVMPGRSGDRQAQETLTARTFRSVAGWTRDRDPELDYGAILITGGSAPGHSLGWFGFGTVTDAQLQSASVNLAGYPHDKPEWTLWWHARRISTLRPNSLGYTLDTNKGQSGGPLWRKDGNSRQVVGIHAGGLGGLNQAVRINNRVVSNLKSWNTAASQP